MTIKQLKELIKNLPDDVHIVLSGPDHSYRIGRARVVNAAYSKAQKHHAEYLGEWFGSQDDYDEPMEVITVLLVD